MLPILLTRKFGISEFKVRNVGFMIINAVSVCYPSMALKESIDIEMLPDEESGLYRVIGGFVMMHLEEIPFSSDRFLVGRPPL
jgi:hypothetical protein